MMLLGASNDLGGCVWLFFAWTSLQWLRIRLFGALNSYKRVV